MKCLSNVLLFVLAVGPMTAAQNQDSSRSSSDVPRIIEITHLDVTSGGLRGPTDLIHDLQGQARNDSSMTWIAGNLTTGQGPQLALISMHSNYAHLDKWHRLLTRVEQAQDRSQQPMVTWHSAVFEMDSDLSFNPQHVPWSRAHAYSLSTIYVRRGTGGDYAREQALAAAYWGKQAKQTLTKRQKR